MTALDTKAQIHRAVARTRVWQGDADERALVTVHAALGAPAVEGITGAVYEALRLRGLLTPEAVQPIPPGHGDDPA